ncbi:ABC transporter substrate-binding protein [Cocleimonas flava]|uniref:Amino acid ABC transporter substrate-binding protein (PAAT family) n=1 Tax=Cocleimonas flava TaxID=634765 RepID=A0A4V2P8A8_9GAMM|nr:ABC transporter substrate-binding protein [Cocleimonas flava]TCJ85035.1 amino acid ABC transporter substrate-binding protein (PAAT family) [Cocleimonas flava]
MKKRLTISSLLLSVSLLFTASAFSETLRIGVEGAYPPFSKVDKDGKLSGFDIDMANALCKEMGVECKLIKQDWDGIIPALIAKKYDAIVASMSITEERKEKVDFTNHYYKSPARFIHKKGADHVISAEGLKGKSVGVQRGTVSDKFITGTFGEGVDIKRYGTQEEAYLDLNAGRLDFVFADAFVLLEFINSDNGKDYEFIGDSYTDPKYFGEGIGIAIRKGDTELANKFNTALENLRKSPYDKVREKYFDFDVFGE